VRQRSLGKTGIECSELGLGTWGLSGSAYGSVKEDEQDRVIARARALGITLFDTADTYAGGAMQERLVRILGNDDRCCIVTKIGTMVRAAPPRKCFDEEFLHHSFCAATARLHPRPPDVVLLHNPSLAVIVRGNATAWLSERTEAGVMRSWGVSAGSAEIAQAAIDSGAPIVELAFNVLWAEDFRAIEQRAREKEVGLLARSVLAHGLLSGLWSRDRSFPEGDHRAERWTEEELRCRIRQLDALRPLVRGDVSTLRAAALRWVLGHELVSSAVLGPRNCLQLDQLIREAGKGPPYLPTESLSALESGLKDLGARP
jgi:aryl-alcohol dehydrogenase-like predicted oxidoreductase